VTVPDPRVEQYARVMVETCVDVQPGWEVMVVGGVQGRPLMVEVARQLARRGAYALMRPRFGGNYVCATDWAREAPLQLLENASPIEVDAMQRIDALLGVDAPENTRALAALTPERSSADDDGSRPAIERMFNGDLPWVGGQFPTDALAQDAGMATDLFADFLYAAVLLDWDAGRERMQGYADLFDAGDEVRIVGAESDLRLSIAGREVVIDAGGKNLPAASFSARPSRTPPRG
jgi:aminopeptidase